MHKSYAAGGKCMATRSKAEGGSANISNGTIADMRDESTTLATKRYSQAWDHDRLNPRIVPMYIGMSFGDR